MHILKLSQMGNAVALILPPEVLLRLKLAKGDSVVLTDAPEVVTITAYAPDVEEQLRHGRKFMQEFDDTFQAWLNNAAVEVQFKDSVKKCLSAWTARNPYFALWKILGTVSF